VSLDLYLQRGLYAIIRKCPTAYSAFGHDSIWELSTGEFKWLLESLSEEFKQVKK